jgi:ATP-dependent Zn protease
MWRTAVHEAGHVVAYNAISPDLVIRVRISRHNDDVVGSLTELSNDALMASVRQITMAGVRQQLVALLAGRAAEIELIGAASGGSGGASNSDLARATRIAVQALACCGLGDVDLTYRGEASHVLNPKFLDGDRELRQEVSWLLSSCHDEARQLVRERREALTYVAKRMVEDLELSAAQLKTLLDDCRAHESPDITGGDVDTDATPLASSRCEAGAATTSSATTTPTAPIIGNPGHPEVGNDL